MQITPVDNELNLYRITSVMPDNLVQQVMTTDWLSMPWKKQEGQESWRRRRIQESAIPWIQDWDSHFVSIWPSVAQQIGRSIAPYSGTAFWIDEPGFVCTMHTDGELPGSLHLTWRGPGTAFYWYKDVESLRYQVPEEVNSGYIMINQPDAEGYRRLMWHAMLTPVPEDNYRLTTYTWIFPQ
jgi:hypothetical protein